MGSNPPDSGYLDTSCSVSSPDILNDTPIIGSSRKRKASSQNISDTMDCYSPQFSSTLNESVMKNFEKFHLDHEQQKVFSNKSLCVKQSDGMENRKFCSVPNTPEHQVKHSREFITKKANTNSYVKNFSKLGMLSQSPLNKELFEILYPELPSLEPKKPATPIKSDKGEIQAKKRLFYVPKCSPLKQILSNSIIMKKILKHLSNGDLYRLAKVSSGFRDAITGDLEACNRFSDYSDFYKHHKENYRITPPCSPERDAEMEMEASPGSKNFKDFFEFAKGLNKNQSLIKCPKCQQPSIVEKSICQCQNNRCGYIFCKNCESFAYNPKDFKNKCNNAQLMNTTLSRHLLGDLSNSTSTSDYMTDSSFFSSSQTNSSSSCKYDSSGFFSDCEISTPKQSVKRNLTKSFMVPSEVKIFSSNKKISTPQPRKQPRRPSLVPIVPLEEKTENFFADVTEPSSSPPRVKQHSACSKQSKRNLKRLTR